VNTKTSELDMSELEAVSGGMKWTPVANPDVIDARGGSFSLFGYRVTFDVGGHISSFGRV